MNKKKTKRGFSFYAINAITLYRLVATLLLVYLIYQQDLMLFKWLLAFSFFTDTFDGFLARKFKVVSVLGSRMDSVADDLTVLVALIGLYFFKHDFLLQYGIYFLILLILYFIQVGSALVRYHKFTSFHTYSAKFSFLLQGCFLILLFFMEHPPMPLFYAAVFFTMYMLTEETIMVYLIPEWQSDIKGIYWYLQEKKK